MPDSLEQARPARYWQPRDRDRVRCDLCPRFCIVKPGRRGACFVRANRGGEMVLTTYGRSSGFCIDPIEKKPLAHFLPGTPVLSFGTAGCNLACRFCQNWGISAARETDLLAEAADPDAIARAAHETGCPSIAFTYNDPVVFLEYAIDVADACRERGIKTVAVTAGYLTAAPRAELFALIDAANIDLKFFEDSSYRQLARGTLAPVLETIEYVHHETETWLEITTLVIPGHNDGDDEIARLSGWMVERLGPEVPLHLSAFHPDHLMTDVPPTPVDTLRRAREIARAAGLSHVYLGNVADPAGGSTRCPGCDTVVIGRRGYSVCDYRLTDRGECDTCGRRLAGVFADAPGDWGGRVIPIRMGAR